MFSLTPDQLESNDFVTSSLMQTRIWRVSAVPGLELLCANMPVAGFPREVHEALSIGLLERGGEIYHHRRGAEIVGVNDITFVNPLEPHSSTATTTEGFTYRAFQPDPQWLEALCGQLGAKMMAFRAPAVRDAALAGRLLELHRDLECPASNLEVTERVTNAFIELLQRYGDAKLEPQVRSEPRGVRLARDYLETNLGRNVTLNELARVAELSAFRLSRMFASVIGVPPHVYQTARRVERAKVLLRGGRSAAEVALEVGFFDQSHLNRHFKRLVGVSSAAYQKQVLGL
jgi:AraC-like DNA-binding protein